ncbi:protein of unknown function [Modestobacter italicus]|uniref:Uncharacterized protein n=1 Tax=Modestobacter italicus (strain DSM 44449 / CECT 9708 / BC 501) TaxID=2732864 RepID=I4EYJ9_MODI5|nr:hypothetical protein [Modestobacter marinus]CCH88462.1 protein of unknown function [Modestobacter marinus]
MSDQQPHRNEPGFYRYPMHQLVAVLDDQASADDAVEKLRGIDVDVSEVHVLSGPEGAALLDRTGQRHGLRGQLLRLLQWTSSENDTLDLHDRALRNGGHVVYVPVRGEDRKKRVAGALRAAGGHLLVYFGRFTTEKRWI